MNGVAIKDLAEGQPVEGVFLLSACQVLVTKTGKPYGALKLGDRSAEIEARLWDQAEQQLADLSPGQAVRVQGRVESFKGNRQVILRTIQAAPDVDPFSFVPASPIPFEELQKELNRSLGWVKDKNLKRLLKLIFVDDTSLKKGFLRAPAAKGAHHAYMHGLLEHTLSVTGLARRMTLHYPEQLSADLLLAGALVHDLGKVEEFSLGPPIEYTDQGRLLGHIVQGVQMLEKLIARLPGFPGALKDALMHLVLSHHGEYEFGSPRRPKTAEAMALHFADDMDAKMAMFKTARDNAGGETWSPYNRLLSRYLYVGPDPLHTAPREQEQACPEPSPGLSLFSRNGREPGEQ